MTACFTPSCEREARMAVRATRPTREDLRVTAYADNRSAPKAATSYCKACGQQTVRELLDVVVDADE